MHGSLCAETWGVFCLSLGIRLPTYSPLLTTCRVCVYKQAPSVLTSHSYQSRPLFYEPVKLWDEYCASLLCCSCCQRILYVFILRGKYFPYFWHLVKISHPVLTNKNWCGLRTGVGWSLKINQLERMWDKTYHIIYNSNIICVNMMLFHLTIGSWVCLHVIWCKREEL